MACRGNTVTQTTILGSVKLPLLRVFSTGLTFTGFGICLQLVAWLALALVVVLAELNTVLLTAPVVNAAGIDSWSQGNREGKHINNLGGLISYFKHINDSRSRQTSLSSFQKCSCALP